MKNVLVTATTFPRWENDTEPSFVFTLSRLLAKRGCNITVLAPHYPNAKKFERIGSLKVYRFQYFYPAKLERLCYEGGILENLKRSFLAKIQVPFLFISEYFCTIKIIKKEKISIVHAHWILPQGFLAALIKKFYNLPYIATAHAGDIFPLKKGMLKNIARLAIRNSSFVTANSSFTKASILGIFPHKTIEIIPMGVDLSQFNPKNRNGTLRQRYKIEGHFILFVGRLAEKKGVEYLIKAMPSVLNQLPSSKLLIVGDGREMPALASLVKQLNLQNNVAFAGKIRNEELPKFYATADVFVGPSIVAKNGDTEGLGVVFLEAIASGACVIGTNVGGIPDIIKNNKTGILVEEKNSQEFAQAIVRLLKDKSLRKKLSKNAIKHIKDIYSWDKVADRFARLYSKME